MGPACPVTKRRVGRKAIALVLKTSGRNPLQVRVLHPPFCNGVEKNRYTRKGIVSSNLTLAALDGILDFVITLRVNKIGKNQLGSDPLGGSNPPASVNIFPEQASSIPRQSV